MDSTGFKCCLCSAENETCSDLENHILTDHSHIFRSTPDLLDEMRIVAFPKKIEEAKKFETDLGHCKNLRSVKRVKSGSDIPNGTKNEKPSKMDGIKKEIKIDTNQESEDSRHVDCDEDEFPAFNHGLTEDKSVKTFSEKIETEDSKQSEDLKSKIEIKFGLVVIEGKQCSKCNLVATDEILLNDHMKEKHSKPDEVEQQITIETLNYKLGQTFKEKSKKCSDCEKSFRKSSHLKRHQKAIHTSKSKACAICKKSFFNLYEHYQEAHEGTRYSCFKCEITFKKEYGLKRHQKNVHSREAKVNCHVCNKLFSDSSTRNRHYREIHCEKIVKCLKCKKSFKRPFDLKIHQQKIHNLM
jgi:hypothetical protein